MRDQRPKASTSPAAQTSDAPSNPTRVARKRRRRKQQRVLILPTVVQWREVGRVTLGYLVAIVALL